MHKVREIIRLATDVGLSERAVSRAVQVSRPVVSHYLVQARQAGLQWDQIARMSDEELLERLRRGKEAQPDPRLVTFVEMLPYLVSELGKKRVTRQLLWEEYRHSHPDGYSYTQFCFHLQSHTETAQLSMHLDHKPGDKLFVDYAGERPRLTDPKTGLEMPVELFVAVLPSSGLIYTEAVESQDLACFTSATGNAMQYIGGVPRLIVPDNLKSAVNRPDRYEPQINETFQDFARHYGCAVIPARVRKPKDKALVEAAVNLVYTRIMARLRNQRFPTIGELNTAIWEHLEALNDRPMQLIKLSRQQRFDELEKQHLGALPADAYELRRFEQPRVQTNYHVYLRADRHYYSVPYTYARKLVKVAFSRSTVEIYHNNERIAMHRRDLTPGVYTTTVHHMPSTHRAMVEWTPERFIRWAAKIGPSTCQATEVVLSATEVPEQAFRRCHGLLSLAKRFGDQRLEAACTRAVHFETVSYRSVKSILDNGMDQQELAPVPEHHLPAHQNIRGAAYYGKDQSVEVAG